MVTVTMPQEQIDIAVLVLLGEAQRLWTEDRGAARTLLHETLPPLAACATEWVQVMFYGLVVDEAPEIPAVVVAATVPA
jgi:hypothetical protein